MAVESGMFLFEVVVAHIKSFSESRHFVVRSEFADLFSLELKDPKHMNIFMPEQPPPPPEPPGKKGKKKKKPKAKKGKKKKGKKGVEPLPPPEPTIRAGQSVLFTSTPEFLIQTMKKSPLEISLWSKEDYLSCIGSAIITWDPVYIEFLQKVYNCEDPPPVTLDEEYNVFEEGTAKLMAKIGLQIKLSYLKDKVTTSFRCITEDLTTTKYLYTGLNSKTTSYMCTTKNLEPPVVEKADVVCNNFVHDKPVDIFADYKNAPPVKLNFLQDGEGCCLNKADKAPDSRYKSPEYQPTIDSIIAYVRDIIQSCNDNMRMLTPRPTIRPRVRATDIDKLCYCKEIDWPKGELAERFRKAVQGEPCPICAEELNKSDTQRTFDIANIRGLCGRTDCKVARQLRAYITSLIQEDNKEIDINEIIGPCGNTDCTLAERIQQFLRCEGIFKHGSTKEGLSTQCACIKQMQEVLCKKDSCLSVCSNDCEGDDDPIGCEAIACPFTDDDKIQTKSTDNPEPSRGDLPSPPKNPPVYNVNYFTVEYDFDAKSHETTSASTPKTASSSSLSTSKYEFCGKDCPSHAAEENAISCSKTTCLTDVKNISVSEPCKVPECPPLEDTVSLADDDVELKMDDITNQCCVKSCDAAERVKDFIVEGLEAGKNREDPNSCMCDCVCDYNFSKKTTYCAVCEGYECLGEDIHDLPEYARPFPCPVYHKLYDKNMIKVISPWQEQNEDRQDKTSVRSTRSKKSAKKEQSVKTQPKPLITSYESVDKKTKKQNKTVKPKSAVPPRRKPKAPPVSTPKKKDKGDKSKQYIYPPVPADMGWNWKAKDIIAMKPRPKWAPGAVGKKLLRRYRLGKEGLDVIAKKKRAMMQKKKKLEMKPTLVVKKHNGDYSVQMEILKKFSKERLLFQYPYEEKLPLIYTIGKTDAETHRRKRDRERKERRETRRKAKSVQSAFRDRCQEICLKAYNQAIGVLPRTDPNDPQCPCETNEPLETPSIQSCSCSDEDNFSSSDTDNDSWIVEFTPPAARWNVKAKHPPVLADSESQYNYLDYKVKLLDSQGKEVARFFKGPDGKQQCSDLGGFWDPNHVWLEINKDGYIGPDNRWVPNTFIGPDKLKYTSEDGCFTDSSGRQWRLGIDGYIDKDGKWCCYAGIARPAIPKLETDQTKKSKSASPAKQDSAKDGKDVKIAAKTKVDEQRAKEFDKRHATTNNVPVSRGKKTVTIANVMTISGYKRNSSRVAMSHSSSRIYSSSKIYSPPSEATLRLDSMRLAKYREVMNDPQMYGALADDKPSMKTNRASNTSGKKVSPFTLPLYKIKTYV